MGKLEFINLDKNRGKKALGQLLLKKNVAQKICFPE